MDAKDQKPVTQSGTPKVAIAVALALIIVLGVATALISSNQNDKKKEAPTVKKQSSHISDPTNKSYILNTARKNNVSQFFWLGDPVAGEDVRVDLLRRPAQLEIGYLSPQAQKAFSTDRPAFTTLVVTQPFTPGRSLEVLKNLSSGIIKRNGYSVYLPPKKYLKQRRIFAVSDDLKTVGIILSTGKPTVSALHSIAARVQLEQVPKNN